MFLLVKRCLGQHISSLFNIVTAAITKRTGQVSNLLMLNVVRGKQLP